MASQVIASQLGMELYKAELSAIVSKIVGETEKNLKRIFEDAKKSKLYYFLMRLTLYLENALKLKTRTINTATWKLHFFFKKWSIIMELLYLLQTLLKT